jgi:hypothetical protein
VGLRSFINVRPPLAAGETIRWQTNCGYSLDTSLVGGNLFLTSSELIFMPNRLSGRRRSWGPQRMTLSEIADVGVAGRTGTPYNGGWRNRMQIEMRSGKRHLIVVKHPDEVARTLRSAIGLRFPGSRDTAF